MIAFAMFSIWKCLHDVKLQFGFEENNASCDKISTNRVLKLFGFTSIVLCVFFIV